MAFGGESGHALLLSLLLSEREDEVGRLFGPSRLPAAHYAGAGVVGHGGEMVRPKCSRSAPGYMWFLANSRLLDS